MISVTEWIISLRNNKYSTARNPPVAYCGEFPFPLFLLPCQNCKKLDVNLAGLDVSKFFLYLSLKKVSLFTLKSRTFYPKKSDFFLLEMPRKIILLPFFNFSVKHFGNNIKLFGFCVKLYKHWRAMRWSFVFVRSEAILRTRGCRRENCRWMLQNT